MNFTVVVVVNQMFGFIMR